MRCFCCDRYEAVGSILCARCRELELRRGAEADTTHLGRPSGDDNDRVRTRDDDATLRDGYNDNGTRAIEE